VPNGPTAANVREGFLRMSDKPSRVNNVSVNHV
jgi:hypothetical protein